MAYNFRKFDPHQLLLLPPNLDDGLPQQHLARFLADVVANLDLKPLLRRYRPSGQGGAAFSPAMMLRVLLYAYCVGVPSNRKIAQALIDDVAFRWLAAGNQPDFRTIATFRRQHLKYIKALFLQVLLRILGPAGAPDPYVAVKKDHKQRVDDEPAPRGRLPKNLTQRQRMERKLKTKAGKAFYKLRGQIVEAVFGQIKDCRKLSRFLLRGLEKVKGEFELWSLTDNLLKLYRHGAASG